MQVMRLAVFLERRELAREIAEGVKTKRIRARTSVDGSQPHELGRTLSYDYSLVNLHALALLARDGLYAQFWGRQSGGFIETRAAE